MKKVSFILALIIVMSLLASCGSNYKAFSVDPDYVSVRSDSPNQTISGVDGIKKSVPKTISSIVCFSPDAALILRELGSSGIIKGVDAATAAVVTGNQITVDQIAAQNPDVVFISEDYDTSSLDSADIAYFTIPTEMTLNDVKTLIKVIEKVLGSTNESLSVQIDNESTLAQQTTSSMANKYEAFIDLGNYATTGSGTYINEVLSICGCKNIFDDEEGYITVDKQSVIDANPKFIFTTGNKNTYLDDDDYENVDAVKNGRVYQIKAVNIIYGTQNLADAISDIFQFVSAAMNG